MKQTLKERRRLHVIQTRRWRSIPANREKVRESNRLYRIKNREKCLAIQRKRNVKRIPTRKLKELVATLEQRLEMCVVELQKRNQADTF